MELTVLSMLTTTPLRSPTEGWVPMPIISTPPAETSPTTAQILVVPISSPTTRLDSIRRSPRFPLLCSTGFFSMGLSLFPAGRGSQPLNDNPLAVLQGDALKMDKVRAFLQGQPDLLQTGHLRLKVISAQGDTNPIIQGVEGIAAFRIVMNLRKLVGIKRVSSLSQQRRQSGNLLKDF